MIVFSIYVKVLWVELQHKDWRKKYETDSDFAAQLRHLAALAFVPSHLVEQFSDELVDSDVLPQEAQTIVDYFEDTWIGRLNRRRRGRRSPNFPIEMWNCFQKAKDGLPKTNNAVEGWHRGFEVVVQGAHVNTFKLLNALKVTKLIYSWLIYTQPEHK